MQERDIEKNQKEYPRVGIGIIIEKDGKILIGERIANHGSGTFMIPGGKLEYAETLEHCAVREASEECGLSDLDVTGIVSISNDIEYDTHYVSIVFHAFGKSGEPYDAEPHKSRNWTWTDPRSLPQPMFAHSERAVHNWLNKKLSTNNI